MVVRFFIYEFTVDTEKVDGIRLQADRQTHGADA
jgi:hypothetical protein